jgi:hypothetical protein
MRFVVAVLFVLTTVSWGGQTVQDYVYTSYANPSLLGDLKEPFKVTHFSEIDQFDFEKNYGTKLFRNCTPLGNQLLGESVVDFLRKAPSSLSDELITSLVKGTITLTKDDRNQIWKGPDAGPRVVCTFEIETYDQAREFSEYFRRYTRKKLDLPWYEGLLSETFGKFAPYWTVGKTAFDFLDRKPQDMITAASLMALMAKGGEIRRVIYFDNSNWDYFEVATEYSVQVGKNERQTHARLYSIVYHLDRKQ